MYTDLELRASREALHAHESACLRLFLELDEAVSLSPSMRLSTAVLKALDDARETAAQMWQYLPTPAAVINVGPIIKPNYESGPSIRERIEEELAEQPAGPTQDQEEPESIPAPGDLDMDENDFCPICGAYDCHLKHREQAEQATQAETHRQVLTLEAIPSDF